VTTPIIKSRGAVVLCGGGSTRMGRDKAMLPFGEEVLLERMVRVIGEIVPLENIVVVAAANQELPPLPPAIKVICDEAPGLGPLPAMAAGLQALSTHVESAFVTGCDAPLLKRAAVRWLVERLERPDEDRPDGVALQDAERLYPLFAAYRTSAAGGFARAFESGDASLHGALQSGWLHVRFINVEELRGVDPRLESLMNCNTPEEYQAALATSLLAEGHRSP
jgi:molybdopterin-guanine dinucleotide biosynthesis protein A